MLANNKQLSHRPLSLSTPRTPPHTPAKKKKKDARMVMLLTGHHSIISSLKSHQISPSLHDVEPTKSRVTMTPDGVHRYIIFVVRPRSIHREETLTQSSSQRLLWPGGRPAHAASEKPDLQRILNTGCETQVRFDQIRMKVVMIRLYDDQHAATSRKADVLR